MKESLTKQKLDKKYTFDFPVAARIPKVLHTFTGIKTLFNDPAKFKVIYEKYGYGSILMFDEIAKWVFTARMTINADCIALDTTMTRS
jgi:linoleate 10R-lipoxygenase